MRKRKTITVIYKTGMKFNGDPAFGHSYGNFSVGVDKRLKGKKLLEIIVHECLHELWPKAGESTIEYNAAVLARTLWKEGFRKVDNHSKDFMQDE